jgi:hypothetical protein
MKPLCKTCSKPLYSRNVTGYCKDHVINDEFRAKVSAGMRRRMVDPLARQQARETLAANRHVPGAREARSAAAKRIGLYKLGHKALEGDTEARKRAGRHHSQRRLAGIPSEQWDTYRNLVKYQHMTAEEARALVFQKHEDEAARIRRQLSEARA